ncbi:hypothetical protein pb186bvf_015046 [Paramecium bursaria]
MLDRLLVGLGSKFKQQYIKWLKVPQGYLRVLQQLDYRDSFVAAQTILPNNQIMLISTEKCLTNVELVGCSPGRVEEINSLTQKLATKYYPKQLDQQIQIQGLLKIILQLFVQRQDSTQLLYPYAQILKPPMTPLNWSQETLQMAPPRIQSFIESQKNFIESVHQDLYQNNIYGIQDKEFHELFQIVRNNIICLNPEQPKHFDQQSLLVMCPLISLIEHSFDPNCYLDGYYLSFENMSYVEVSSNKQILPGEKITINYGNLPNIDLVLRHGFMVPSNPYNQLKIFLDFENEFEHAGKFLQLKQKLIKQSQISDIEYTQLYSNKINQQLLQYLRIYFLSEDDISSNPQIQTYKWEQFEDPISSDNETKVKQFMIKNLKVALQEYNTIQPKNAEQSQLQQLIADEIQILQNNLRFFQQ